MARSTLPTAPIAGLSPGVQSQGIWVGRRQLFVRFAGEAETAVLYSSEMLAKQLERATSQAQANYLSQSMAGSQESSLSPMPFALRRARQSISFAASGSMWCFSLETDNRLPSRLRLRRE